MSSEHLQPVEVKFWRVDVGGSGRVVVVIALPNVGQDVGGLVDGLQAALDVAPEVGG